jgi:DNA-binding MarR family transcriptional regulator
MTRTVTALVERGLVERIEDPQDRRQVLVSLTPAGRQVLSDARNRRNEWLARRLAELEPAERRLLAEATAILQRMSRM